MNAPTCTFMMERRHNASALSTGPLRPSV
jgi:hypothetical protein